MMTRADESFSYFFVTFQDFLAPLCNMSMDEGRQIFGLLRDQIDMEQVQIEVGPIELILVRKTKPNQLIVQSVPVVIRELRAVRP
jgi:hypothetical protein